MKISSSVFEDGEKIPVKYTCDGEDISPPLSIEDVPPEAESLAVVVDDPDAPGGVFDHWIIWNIPPGTDSISEGVPAEDVVDSLKGARQGQNGFGEVGYRGPCPPPGPPHNYRFKIYALDTEIGLNPGMKKEDLEREIQGHVLAEDQIVGVFGR
ncbi:hypothetical protein AKJ65_01885 [candidate division MSBL1 archaeon SCGC-AAA259E19]|uniref:Phosphatidylethanolamine-binding protein n=1 Tax=candidate division MSBL1 archaeon SCGC-AAA259E19 TaxID=1698264 RepID=A0A133UMP4_9EURY|nr:hypothetical protein AKJ65_01885 [candidate division MSBL1 archaeon SCGC-AAA259E19]